MKTKEKEHPFSGIWYVAVHDLRVAGKWERANEFEQDEWVIGFTPDGRFLEMFRPESERTVCTWTFDESTGIISVFPDPSGSASVKCVFAREGNDGFLYYYDDLPHIPENAAAIIRHHAHTRQKLVRVDELH